MRSYFWSVFSRIQSECGKIRTRNNPVFGHFSRRATLNKLQCILEVSSHPKGTLGTHLRLCIQLILLLPNKPTQI